MRSVTWLRPVALAVLVLAACCLLAVPSLQAEEGQPVLLWKVQGENATLHLTGSIHVGKPDFFPLADPIEEAFAQADALAVEVDVSDPDVIAKMMSMIFTEGMLPEGETLQDRLGEELYARLERMATEREFPLAMIQKMKPGIVILTLLGMEYQRVGLDPELGIDMHFLAAASEAGKEIIALETIESQLALFLEVDDQLDDVFVAEFLDQIDEIVEVTEEMIALWQAADMEALIAFVESQVGDDPLMVGFYDRLMNDRNVKMVETLDQWLRESEKDIFVTVGAGHFGGEKGILSLLAEKGWKAEQYMMEAVH